MTDTKGSDVKYNFQGYTLLVIDDTRTSLAAVGNFLEAYGFEVIRANNGEEALELLESTPVDVILLDVMMPGLDGYETCHRLKANPATRHIPVIFMNANVHTGEKWKGFEVGGVDYISRPILLEVMLVRVSHQIQILALTRELETTKAELAELNQKGVF